MMMEHPNLIRRPILIRAGRRSSSASTRTQYGSLTCASGTSGWNYPTGQGTWNGIFYPPARGRAERRSTSSRSTPSTSTPSR